jgi:Asp-tRNA(Asn)/Glu-tRNA(Gln) amidotransferase A subunit family amidase
VLVGKTVTTEFAIGESGPTTNPFDRKRTPGGSSSGSAAAVACGMVPAALGTQTVGSIVRPASYCGIVGFKPTTGLLHMGGIHTLSKTCDHLGVLAATVEDAWLIASRISLGVGSPGSRFLPAAETLPAAQKPASFIRLYTDGWHEIDDETKDRFEDEMARVRSAGVAVASRDTDRAVARLEKELESRRDAATALTMYEMTWPFCEYIRRHGKRIGPQIRAMMEQSAGITPSDYEAMLAERARVQKAVAAAGASHDAFVTVASSGPAPLGLKHTGSRTFPSYGSWLGLPAFSLPLMRVGHLPVGVQILGLHERDDRLCAIARWMMQEGSAQD